MSIGSICSSFIDRISGAGELGPLIEHLEETELEIRRLAERLENFNDAFGEAAETRSRFLYDGGELLSSALPKAEGRSWRYAWGLSDACNRLSGRFTRAEQMLLDLRQYQHLPLFAKIQARVCRSDFDQFFLRGCARFIGKTPDVDSRIFKGFSSRLSRRAYCIFSGVNIDEIAYRLDLLREVRRGRAQLSLALLGGAILFGAYQWHKFSE